MTAVVVTRAQRLGRILGCHSWGGWGGEETPPKQLATGLAPQWEDQERVPPSLQVVTQVIVPSTKTSPGGCWKTALGRKQ